MARASDRTPLFLLAAVALAFVVLGWSPKADRFTWFMENLPVLAGVPALVATHRRFPLSNLLYVLLARAADAKTPLTSVSAMVTVGDSTDAVNFVLWLRALITGLRDAPIPILAGGHTLVGPGIRLLATRIA